MRPVLLFLLAFASALAQANDILASNYFGDDIARFSLADGSYRGSFGAGHLDGPLGMRLGPDGKLYVASELTNSVVRFNASTGDYLDTFAGGTGFDGPTGVTFDATGNALVGNFNDSSVAKFSPSGAYLGKLVPTGSGGLNGPDVGSVIHDGVLYVPSFYSNAVLKYDALTGAPLGAITGGGLTQPRTILFRDNLVWVASDNGNKVLRYHADGNFADTFISRGANGLSGVSGMTFGGDGYLYVASWRSNQILRYNETTGAFGGVFATTHLNGPTFLMAVPEPSTLGMATMGLAGLARFRRSKVQR